MLKNEFLLYSIDTYISFYQEEPEDDKAEDGFMTRWFGDEPWEKQGVAKKSCLWMCGLDDMFTAHYEKIKVSKIYL